MLELKKIRVAHVVASQLFLFPLIIKIGFMIHIGRGGVLKFMKNYHIFSFNYQIIILAVWVLSPKFLGRLRSSFG